MKECMREKEIERSDLFEQNSFREEAHGFKLRVDGVLVLSAALGVVLLLLGACLEKRSSFSRGIAEFDG